MFIRLATEELVTVSRLKPLSIEPTDSKMLCNASQEPVSPVSLTVPTRNFQSQFKHRILVANWKKIPRQFH